MGDWEEYKLKKNDYNVLLNDFRAQDISNKINKNKDTHEICLKLSIKHYIGNKNQYSHHTTVKNP